MRFEGRSWLAAVFGAAAAAALPATLALAVAREDFSPSAAGWVYLAGVAAAAGLEAFAAQGTRSGPAAGQATASEMAPAVFTGLVLLATAVVALCAPDPHPGPAGLVVGLGLMAAGAVLRFSAVCRLGPRFRSDNAVGVDAALERCGVYRRLAHPSELGLLALVVGGLCLVRDPWFGGLATLLYGLQAWRLKLEEQALFGRYGEMYVAYRRGTLDPWPSVVLIARGRAK